MNAIGKIDCKAIALKYKDILQHPEDKENMEKFCIMKKKLQIQLYCSN